MKRTLHNFIALRSYKEKNDIMIWKILDNYSCVYISINLRFKYHCTSVESYCLGLKLIIELLAIAHSISMIIYILINYHYLQYES